MEVVLGWVTTIRKFLRNTLEHSFPLFVNYLPYVVWFLDIEIEIDLELFLIWISYEQSSESIITL